ncbi:hypothetical protein BU14_0333s0025 [Porphyra umbilicalis]|uniref:Uncharacterized protein n=1 Tax=Porphyra umbilicalis TaxID=2786 RepID=A0A1X6NYJ8_PORUM|nr:hypothetical protein BU14_0333s0025 [Porphyra umbilicalis]|eukprot:OSX73637.1 hypothetical protein BU14_0333s0025 [Porphyra umbilicalis]
MAPAPPPGAGEPPPAAAEAAAVAADAGAPPGDPPLPPTPSRAFRPPPTPPPPPHWPDADPAYSTAGASYYGGPSSPALRFEVHATSARALASTLHLPAHDAAAETGTADREQSTAA